MLLSPVAGPAEMSPNFDQDRFAVSTVVTVDETVTWEFMTAAEGASSVAPPPVVRTAPAASRSSTSARMPAGLSTATVQDGSVRSQVLAEARKHIGARYVHGGRTPGAFDCSGYTSYVFAKFGVYLTPQSEAQRRQGRVVPASEALPGDLVWWPGHVGIYTGNGNHIAARNPSTTLYESRLFRSGVTFIRVLD